MMHLWFFIALIGPIAWALTNHIDKLLLEKYFKERGVGALMIFSSILAVVVLPFLYLADPTVLAVSGFHIFVLSINSVIAVTVLWLYFMALKDEEASIVVVFYQLIPVFGLVLGYFLLGEVLSELQMLAMALVIIGASTVSFEIDAENRFTLRRKTALLMILAAFLSSFESVLFKWVALEENVWRSIFWEFIALVVIGALILIFVRSYRNDFLASVRNNSKAIFSLNVLNELLYMIGNISFGYAYLLAPVALVLLVNSYQPLFVLAIGVFLTVFFPRISVEKIRLRNLVPKLLAVVLTGIGTYLLFSA